MWELDVISSAKFQIERLTLSLLAIGFLQIPWLLLSSNLSISFCNSLVGLCLRVSQLAMVLGSVPGFAASFLCDKPARIRKVLIFSGNELGQRRGSYLRNSIIGAMSCIEGGIHCLSHLAIVCLHTPILWATSL